MGCYNQANQQVDYGYGMPLMEGQQGFMGCQNMLQQPMANPAFGGVGFEQSPMGFNQQSPIGCDQQSPISFLYHGTPWDNYILSTYSQKSGGIPKQAKMRNQRPPSSTEPKRKVNIGSKSFTTLATPLAKVPEVGKPTEEEPEDLPPDHERFDTITLALGTKPGSNKPAKILVSLKTPKVLDANLNTGTVGTQVGPSDLAGSVTIISDDAKSGKQSLASKKSRKSKASKKGKKSKTSKKGGKKGKGKK